VSDLNFCDSRSSNSSTGEQKVENTTTDEEDIPF
jgi:hypothetical protein